MTGVCVLVYVCLCVCVCMCVYRNLQSKIVIPYCRLGGYFQSASMMSTGKLLVDKNSLVEFL